MGYKPRIPSGKHTQNYGTSPFLMGKSTNKMAMFNSNLFVYQRVGFMLKKQPLLIVSLNLDKVPIESFHFTKVNEELQR